MVLFLDIDGVLQAIPSGENGHFFHIDRIESVVREFPFINIVISSSWREVYPGDVVVGIFEMRMSGTFAARIGGLFYANTHIGRY